MITAAGVTSDHEKGANTTEMLKKEPPECHTVEDTEGHEAASHEEISECDTVKVKAGAH